MLPFTRKLFIAGVNLYGLLLTAWLLLRLWRGEQSALIGLMNAIGVWWFVPLIVLLPLALLSRTRQTLIMLSFLVLPALFFFSPDLVPHAWSSPLPAESEIRLRVFNLNALVSNVSYEAVAARISEHEPDLIAIQELSHEMARSLNAELAEDYPYQLLHPMDDVRGIGIWSRYPLTEGLSRNQDWWERWLYSAIVDVEGEQIHLFNVHLVPIKAKSRHAIAQRLAQQHAQAQELHDLVSKADMPVLVVGDLNASPTNETYHILDEELDDAWREVSTGLGFTFPAPGSIASWLPPILRIDYFWTGGNITPIKVEVLPEVGSDHLPLLGEFSLP